MEYVVNSNSGVPCVVNTQQNDPIPAEVQKIRSYKRRMWMLALFSFTSVLCGLLYSVYMSMAALNGCYYGVTQQAVNWTGLIYMLIYMVFIFHASKLIQFMDLRWTVILSSLFNTVACTLQFLTLNRSAFAWVMVSSTFASLSNLFVLGVPPFLAARWFPSNELSRACALGVFGNQLGVASGFLFPPMLVTSDCSKTDEVEAGKLNLAIILTVVNAVVLMLIIFTFQNAPIHPPSLAQAVKAVEESSSHFKCVKRILKNKQFLLILVMYGSVVGTYFVLATILNDLVIQYFKDHAEDVGLMGFLLIVAGLVGSVIAGYILDVTKKFKETSLTIVILTLACHIIFSGCLQIDIFWIQYVTITIYGFFLTSFLSVGFEYGVEVTYPESESICACLMNNSTMLFGLILTQIASCLLDEVSPIACNSFIAVNLLMACFVTYFITTDYKRSNKDAATKGDAVGS